MASRVIATPALFDFALTAAHQTYYRGRAGADVFEDGAYYRVLWRGDDVLAVTVRDAGRGKLEVSVLGDDAPDGTLDYACDEMRRLLGFDADLEGFYEACANDLVLASAVDSLHGLRPALSETVFEALIAAVVGQQISGAVARVIRELIVQTFGTPVDIGGETLYAFPKPETIAGASHEELLKMKLSNRKAEYVRDIALKTLDGTIDDAHLAAMDDEEAIAHLISCRGIGRWTAEWMLLRALGRPDVFPVGDLALKRVVSEQYFDGAAITEQQLADFGRDHWAPYRGLATTYVFADLRRQRAAANARKTATGDALG